MFDKRYRAWLLSLVVGTVVVLAFPNQSFAIPAFSRLYGTSCSTCHIDFPKLNDFGKAFKDAGFKFPTDDESMLKIPPVLLGAPANKELWPKSIWPGQLPGLPPIGLRFNTFYQVVGKNRGKFDPFLLNNDGIPAFVPRTDFEPGLFSIFMAGNFGSDIAFWVDDDLSVAGSNDGGLGDGYLKFVNISRFFHLPKDSMHLRIGQFELELPFSQARSYNISPWDIYSQANLGVVNSILTPQQQQNVSNGFAFAGAAQGVELSGGHHYGGYYYALAIVNQNTGTQPIDTGGTFVPSATGSNSGGLGFFSDANFKDVYGRLAYRVNLERNPESRHAVQAAGAMGPHDHTYINFGTYYFYGRSVQRFTDGAGGLVTAREPFYRAGGDLTFNYKNNFQIYGLYMVGHDHNLLPFDSTGALVTLPTTGPVAGFVRGAPATFSGGFIQADYMPYPWMMLIMRWDTVHSTADLLNNAGLLTGTAAGSPNFGLPFSSVRNRITPGVQFLIHANIKASFEYQIRPQQSVTLNPTTLLPSSPFRVNTATAALEFVY